jgi:DNA-binding Lrp family transcriptional regulator
MGWRDCIKVHPAADLFPMMGDADLDVLAEDIRVNGLRNIIDIWQPPAGQQDARYLLDGRNRLEAIWRTGGAAAVKRALEERARTRHAGDPYALVVSLNVHRRHLTGEQKRELIATLLKAAPEKSDRQIAETVKASPTTVGTVRGTLEQAGEVSKLDTRIGADGVAQPAKPKPASLPTAPKTPPAQKRATAIIGFAMLLRHNTGDTLDDLTRLLSDEQRRVAEIPLPRRVALARGYLAALGVTLGDLRPI